MSGKTFDPSGEFEKLARQYWGAWGEFAPRAGEGFSAANPTANLPGFKDGLAWWTQLVGRGNSDLEATLERTNAQAGQWFGAIQELAAKFAGGKADAAQIAQSWRDLLGGAGGNPIADMFQRMSGGDAHGFDAWMEQAAPFLNSLRGEAGALLKLPAFGLGREHQERLQKLAQAQIAYQERINAYQGLLAQAGKQAFKNFETKLGERSEPGRQIESARALFDLWIDAAEEAWAEIALTAEYRRVYGDLVNAQMGLRAGVQREIELAAGQFGLPTRSEINASHRKLAALEREVRVLKTQLAQFVKAPSSARSEAAKPKSSAPTDAPREPARRSAPKPAAKKAARAAVAKSAARKLVLPQVTAPHSATHAPTRAKSSTKNKTAAPRKKAR